MKVKKKTPRKITRSGRPVIEINWELVESLLQADCSGVQVAAHIGISEDTLYGRVKKEKGMIFSDYSLIFREKGDSLLKSKQFESAITDKNISMQIWLGKQRLGQSDKREFTGKDGKDLIPKQIDSIKIIKVNILM